MLMPVEDARKRILKAIKPLAAETVSLNDAAGRVLAKDVTAKVSNPPAEMSAMDGYAVRADDVTRAGARLDIIGTAHAGEVFETPVDVSQCVRIFTGAQIPPGADTIIIQEEADLSTSGETMTTTVSEHAGRWVRHMGQDFMEGDILLQAGRRLNAADLALLAASHNPVVEVARKPRVALLSTGDELVEIGTKPGPGQIVASNALMLKTMLEKAGAEVIDLGIARDTEDDLIAALDKARDMDMLVTSGGASVGDKDLIRDVFRSQGMKLDFWKIASKPGKPMMFGHLDDMPVIGLPGNPVSCAVCFVIYILGAVKRLQGMDTETAAHLPFIAARLEGDLPANGIRQEYMRATMAWGEDGVAVVMPFDRQDSALLGLLSKADAYVLREPEAPPALAGEIVQALPLDTLF